MSKSATPKPGRAPKAKKPKVAAPKNESVTETKRSVGRPTLYQPEYHSKQAFQLTLLGLTDGQLAKVIGISEATLNRWKVDYPDFRESIMNGKEKADGEIAASLYQRAKGYEHPDVDVRAVGGEIVETPIIKVYPPDTQALRFWLMNRQPHLFRERTSTEITGKDGGPIETVSGTFTDYDAIKAAIKARKGATA